MLLSIKNIRFAIWQMLQLLRIFHLIWECIWFFVDFFSDSSLLGKSRFQDTPSFVEEPALSYYIVRTKPAVVSCKAINAVRINFRCAEQWMEPTRVENIVNRTTSTKILSAIVNVERADVEEYFGGDFWCECFAYNTHSGPDGVNGKKSRRGTIEIACKYELIFTLEWNDLHVGVHLLLAINNWGQQLEVPQIINTNQK